MIDSFFKGLFMIVVFNFWIWLGSKLWEVVEVEEQEDEDNARFLGGFIDVITRPDALQMWIRY